MVPAYLFLALLSLLQRAAIDAEVLDPREARYVLSRWEHFPADMQLLGRRLVTLSDAPPAHDALRFPPRSVTSDMLAFNRAYRLHLENRASAELHRAEEIREAIQETDRLYQVHDLVRDTRCEYYFVSVRRAALKQLRERLGPAAYFAGSLPPHVPVRFFRAAD